MKDEKAAEVQASAAAENRNSPAKRPDNAQSVLKASRVYLPLRAFPINGAAGRRLGRRRAAGGFKMAETNTGMTDEQFKKQLIHGVKSRMVIMTVAVYNKPRDYPDSYVARVYFSAPGRMWPSKDIFIVRDTLEAIRAAIPMQLMHRLERDINDDPHIIETWV